MEEKDGTKKDVIEENEKENKKENNTIEKNESNEEKKDKKINFLKKIYYSVCKPSEYGNLAKEGVKSALIYFIIILLIITIAPAIFLTYSQSKIATEFTNYLQENLPELTFSDNKLEISDGEVYILNDQKVIDLFGGVVVLNTNLENDEEIKEEYSDMVTDNTVCIIFETDKMQVLYNDSSETDKDEDTEFEKNIQVDNYNYKDYASNFIEDTSKEYSKQDVINYFGNSSVLDSFVQYYIMYFITIVVMMAINIIVIFILAVIISKMFVIPSEIKELFTFSIYSTTLGSILYLLYLIISYITSLNLGDVNMVYLLIAYAYILVILIKKKRMNN